MIKRTKMALTSRRWKKLSNSIWPRRILARKRKRRSKKRRRNPNQKRKNPRTRKNQRRMKIAMAMTIWMIR